MSILIQPLLFSPYHAASCFNKLFCVRVGSPIQVSECNNTPSCSLLRGGPSPRKGAEAAVFHLLPFWERPTSREENSHLFVAKNFKCRCVMKYLEKNIFGSWEPECPALKSRQVPWGGRKGGTGKEVWWKEVSTEHCRKEDGVARVKQRPKSSSGAAAEGTVVQTRSGREPSLLTTHPQLRRSRNRAGLQRPDAMSDHIRKASAAKGCAPLNSEQNRDPPRFGHNKQQVMRADRLDLCLISGLISGAAQTRCTSDSLTSYT